MSDRVGLSIGAATLVAARVGSPAVTRRPVLTVFGDRATVVGAAEPCGVVISGFVERVGDPIPLVAADGSRYPAAQLMAEALAGMVRAVSAEPPSDVVVAVPAYWSATAVGALRDEIESMPARLISGRSRARRPGRR